MEVDPKVQKVNFRFEIRVNESKRRYKEFVNIHLLLAYSRSPGCTATSLDVLIVEATLHGYSELAAAFCRCGCLWDVYSRLLLWCLAGVNFGRNLSDRSARAGLFTQLTLLKSSHLVMQLVLSLQVVLLLLGSRDVCRGPNIVILVHAELKLGLCCFHWLRLRLVVVSQSRGLRYDRSNRAVLFRLLR